MAQQKQTDDMVGKMGSLVEGIQSKPDVRLTLVRPTSLACLLTMVCALKEDEIDVMLKDADHKRGCASKAVSGSEHHALLRMFALPGQDAVDLSDWARRPVTLTRGPHGLGLGIVHLGLGTVMVDATTAGRPAAAAHNIQVGSVIAMIDGADVRNMDFDEVQAALSGASGSCVSLMLLQPHSLGSLLATFLTLQRMLIDDGCDQDYEWWQETAASDEDHDTWSERDGEDDEEEEDADDEGLSSEDDLDLAAAARGGDAVAPAAPARQSPSPRQGGSIRDRSRSTSPCRSEDGGSQSDNPFEIVIEA